MRIKLEIEIVEGVCISASSTEHTEAEHTEAKDLPWVARHKALDACRTEMDSIITYFTSRAGDDLIEHCKDIKNINQC